MTWDPELGCPLHTGQPYDCKLPHPRMSDAQEQKLAHQLDLECGFENCIVCNPKRPSAFPIDPRAPKTAGMRCPRGLGGYIHHVFVMGRLHCLCGAVRVDGVEVQPTSFSSPCS